MTNFRSNDFPDKMAGYDVSDVIILLFERYPDDDNIKKLRQYLYRNTDACFEHRQEILNLISKCLSNKTTTNIIAEYFSPILYDLFIRILKNESKLSLFCTLGRLIGLFVCANNFAYDCFADYSFDSTKFMQMIQNDEDLIDFLESCYRFLKFDLDFFTSHFQWSFLIHLFDSSNLYIRFISLEIHSNILKLNPNIHNNSLLNEENLEKCRLKLYSLNNRIPRLIKKSIQYCDILNNESKCLIYDEDFSKPLVSIKGILLPLTYPNNPQNVPNKFIIGSIFGDNLRSIALGLSLNKPILVQGSMNSGKSTLINYLATLTGRNDPMQLMTIQISDQVDTKYLLGSYVCSNIPGEFLFNPGPLLKAIRNGNWIILEDIDMASSEMISWIISIIQSRFNATIAGCENRIDKFNSNFRIFFTKNLEKSTVPNVNFRILEKMCYVVTLENVNLPNIEKLITLKWPNMQLIISRILSIYKIVINDNLYSAYSCGKIKRCIGLRDLMKWCHRLGKNFQINNNETSKCAFLDAIDCFLGFMSKNNEFTRNLALVLGSYFNLSKCECEYLLEERAPEIFKQINKIKIGRQIFPVTNLSKNLIQFAFIKSTTQLMEKLLVCANYGEPVLLCGETGIGKTSCIQNLAKLCGKKLNIINMNQQSSSMELFGSYKPIHFQYIIDTILEEYIDLFDQTFSSEKNTVFKAKLIQLSNNWNTLFEIMLHVFSKTDEKTKSNNDLFLKWVNLKEKILNYKDIFNDKNKNRLPFAFVEGALTRAIKFGEWVLLDEINLAETETLNGLLCFMENDKKLMLFEKVDDQIISIHEDFRLFACMNPATDVGKKELPKKIRSRFTEFFIDELSDRNEIRNIVCTYLKNLIVPKQIESIVEFYLKIKSDSQTLLKDINGHRPVFSLRNLCRALRVANLNPFNSFQRSLYEAFSLAFLSNLDNNSYKIVETRILEIVFEKKNLQNIFNITCTKSFPSESFVIIENYPIFKGPNTAEIDENYILTSTVKKNIRDICRIISAGRTYPILLQGETSVGKTSLIQYLAKATGNICYRVNNHEHTDLQVNNIKLLID